MGDKRTINHEFLVNEDAQIRLSATRANGSNVYEPVLYTRAESLESALWVVGRRLVEAGKGDLLVDVKLALGITAPSEPE